jgi:hypothetical protein
LRQTDKYKVPEARLAKKETITSIGSYLRQRDKYKVARGKETSTREVKRQVKER